MGNIDLILCDLILILIFQDVRKVILWSLIIISGFIYFGKKTDLIIIHRPEGLKNQTLKKMITREAIFFKASGFYTIHVEKKKQTVEIMWKTGKDQIFQNDLHFLPAEKEAGLTQQKDYHL